jgi:hypothetical protein
MSNLRIVETNVVDQATLGATPAMATTLPVENLKDPRRAYVARTTSTATQSIYGTWSASQWVSAAVLWRHNLSAEATWAVVLYDGPNQTGSVVHNTGYQPAIGSLTLGDLDWGYDPFGSSWRLGHSQPLQSVLWWAPVQARSYIIYIQDAGNPDGYLQVSRLWMGRYQEFGVNPDFGATLQWVDPSEQIRTAGGTLRSDWNRPAESPSRRCRGRGPAARRL